MIHAIDLQRLAGGSDEITENGNVRAVGSDAPSVHGQTEPLGKIEIDTRVVQLRQTETLRRQYTINSRRIHRPRRAVTPPGAPRQLVKLFPIAFVPSRHLLLGPDPLGTIPSTNTLASTLLMQARPIRFTNLLPPLLFQGTAPLCSGLFILHKPVGILFSLPVVSNTLRDKLFRVDQRDLRLAHTYPRRAIISVTGH